MSDQPAPREQTIRQLVEKLSGCMDPKNALTLVLESVALLDQLRTEGQPPRYCTCVANGIELPTAHTAGCRMARTEKPTRFAWLMERRLNKDSEDMEISCAATRAADAA